MKIRQVLNSTCLFFFAQNFDIFYPKISDSFNQPFYPFFHIQMKGPKKFLGGKRMATNYPYYTTPQYYPQARYGSVEQTQPQIKGRPVTSIEEVRAIPIDFDGSVFFFPDIANKHIYTKQINYDGTSTINTYELLLSANKSNEQYVTREEFDRLISQLHQRFAGTELQSAPQQALLPTEAATSAGTQQAEQAPQTQRPQFNF